MTTPTANQLNAGVDALRAGVIKLVPGEFSGLIQDYLTNANLLYLVEVVHDAMVKAK